MFSGLEHISQPLRGFTEGREGFWPVLKCKGPSGGAESRAAALLQKPQAARGTGAAAGTGSNTFRVLAPKPQKLFDDALNVKYIVERRKKKKPQQRGISLVPEMTGDTQ